MIILNILYYSIHNIQITLEQLHRGMDANKPSHPQISTPIDKVPYIQRKTGLILNF